MPSIALTRELRARLMRWREAQLDDGRDPIDWKADAPDRYCPRCGATAGPGSVTAEGCAFCVSRRPAWHRVTRLGEYVPPLDEAIKAMKFAGDWAQACWFGRRLARVVNEKPRENLIVCPVPMHRFRQWRRGYNQAALIAEALAAADGLTVLPLLRRIRHTRPQTLLTASARRHNLVRAFDAYPVDLAGCDVLLIDDVKTTGTTLESCARLLRKQGARTVHCVVVAVADPAHRAFAMT